MAARYMPVMLDLDGKRCLVVGGGHEALRKSRSLLDVGAGVDVVSPAVLPDLQALADSGRVTWEPTTYRPGNLKGYFLVFTCTDDPVVNTEVAAEAQQAGILVNAVDQPEDCTFIMPAVLRRGSLMVAICTDGKSPAFASNLRDRLGEQIGEAHGVLLDVLGTLRPVVRAAGLPIARRSELFTRIVRSDPLSCLVAGDVAGMYQQIEAILKEYEVPWPEELSTWSAPAPALPT